MARSAGVGDPEIRWRYMQDPTFDNQVASLEWEGREAKVRIEKAVPSDPDQPVLEKVIEQRIA